MYISIYIYVMTENRHVQVPAAHSLTHTYTRVCAVQTCPCETVSRSVSVSVTSV